MFYYRKCLHFSLFIYSQGISRFSTFNNGDKIFLRYHIYFDFKSRDNRLLTYKHHVSSYDMCKEYHQFYLVNYYCLKQYDKFDYRILFC